MSNPERQEVTITATVKENGVDVEKAYTLKLSTNATAALEHRLGKTTKEIMEQVANVSIATMRDLMHAMLQKYHGKDFPPTSAGYEKVGDLIDDCGGMTVLLSKMVEAIGIRNETEKKMSEEGPNPTAGQGGIGGVSPLRLAESA